ncbi:MAG: hypothetical protein QHI48_05395 [Bacteroidota bacterium]|nr:hypothetical protein [Bacteroidota bacterium]
MDIVSFVLRYAGPLTAVAFLAGLAFFTIGLRRGGGIAAFISRGVSRLSAAIVMNTAWVILGIIFTAFALHTQTNFPWRFFPDVDPRIVPALRLLSVLFWLAAVSACFLSIEKKWGDRIRRKKEAAEKSSDRHRDSSVPERRGEDTSFHPL